MARKQPFIVRAIADPTKNFLAFFLVGTLLFTVVSDGVSYVFWDLLGTWLESRLGIQQPWFRAIVTMVLLGVLLGLTYGTNLAQWVQERLQWLPLFRTEEIPTANVEEMQTRYPGLIVIMSRKDNSPAEAAILHHWGEDSPVHPLRHCWIICTEQSLSYAVDMEKRLADKGVTQTSKLHYGAYELEAPDTGAAMSLLVPQEQVDDPNYTQRLVNAIYADAEQRGLDESEVIADYTGGMKGATAGMLLACARPERPLQYISQVKSGMVMAVKVSYALKPLGSTSTAGRRRSPIPSKKRPLPSPQQDFLLPDPWQDPWQDAPSEARSPQAPPPLHPPDNPSPPDRPV